MKTKVLWPFETRVFLCEKTPTSAAKRHDSFGAEPQSCQKEQIAFPSEIFYLRHGGSFAETLRFGKPCLPMGRESPPGKDSQGPFCEVVLHCALFPLEKCQSP